MGEYIPCKDTAKLVRVALKKSFPGVKFSVRSDNNSIDVGWTDGPAEKAVKAVAGRYRSGGFDGMIDMEYSSEEWLLPDGSVSAAWSPGTVGSRGIYSPYDNPAPSPEAKRVRFGAKYVFCRKSWSLPVYTAAVEKVCAEYGVPMPEVADSGFGWCSIKPDPFVPNGDSGLSTLVHRELQKENHA